MGVSCQADHVQGPAHALAIGVAPACRKEDEKNEHAQSVVVVAGGVVVVVVVVFTTVSAAVSVAAKGR